MQSSTNSVSNNERLASLVERLRSLELKLAGFIGQKASLTATLASLTEEVNTCQRLDLANQKVQKFYQAVAAEQQQELQRWFEDTVTRGLQAVFGKYRFVITDPEVRGNDIATGFKVLERVGDREFERDPFDEMGGGVSDVLGFLLQFLMIYLLRERIQPILFIDEGFKHLSVEFRANAAGLLEELTRTTPVQIVLITHDEIFSSRADVIYRYSKPEASTIVERLK